MLVPLSWLKEYVDIDVEAKELEEMIENVLESKAANEKNQEVTTRKVVSKEYVDHALHGDKE